MTGKLLVIGDSHACAWAGRMDEGQSPSIFPLVQTLRLGPALAYNLLDDAGIPGKWGRLVLQIINETRTEWSAVMLSFGEIDCASHILKHAIEDGLTIEEATTRVTHRYLAFVRLLQQEWTQPLFLWAPVATPDDSISPNRIYPLIGSMAERNVVTRLFTQQLKHNAPDRVYVVSILEELLTSDLMTRPGFFYDGRHLNQIGLALGIMKLRTVIAHNGLPLPDYFAIDASTSQ